MWGISWYLWFTIFIYDLITDTALCDVHMRYASIRANIILHWQPLGNINTTRINGIHVKCDQWRKSGWYGSLPIITCLQYISETYPTCGMYVRGFCCCSWFVFVFLFLCCGYLIIHYAFKGFIYLYSRWFFTGTGAIIFLPPITLKNMGEISKHDKPRMVCIFCDTLYHFANHMKCS